VKLLIRNFVNSSTTLKSFGLPVVVVLDLFYVLMDMANFEKAFYLLKQKV